MAYFGKEFCFEKEENYNAFVASFGLNEEHTKAIIDDKPNQKLEKVGDGFKLTHVYPGGKTEEFPFKNGVPVEENYGEGAKANVIWTVNGDTFTRAQNFGGGSTITNKMEFSADKLKTTLTSDKWDGVAYKYYTA